MSTKTTIKRIALVAVAGLGLGMISAVSANAATGRTASSITVGTAGPARVGATNLVPVTFNMPSATAGASSDTTTIAAKVTSAPSTSRFIATSVISNSSGARLDWATYSSSNSAVSADAYTAVTTSSGLDAVATSATLTGVSDSDDNWTALLGFTPDVAGTYTILVSTNVSGTAFAAGDPSATITITTRGAAASLVVTSINSTHGESSSSSGGSLVKVVAKDADGNVTVPGENESFLVTTSGSFSISDTTLTASDFQTYGAAFFNVYGSVSADTTETITITGSGNISSSVLSTISIKAIDSTLSSVGNSAFARSATDTTGYATAAATPTNDSDLDYNAAVSQTTHTVRLTFGTAKADDDDFYSIQVYDYSGKATGKAGAYFTLSLGVADGDTYGEVSFDAALGTSSEIQATVTGGASGYQTITYKGRAAVATTLTPDATVLRSAEKATNVLGITLYDQYGLGMSSQSVSVDITGRNATASTKYITTDANGKASYSVADAGTSGTADTVSFASTATGSVTIYYGTVTVGSVTVTGGASADTVAYPAAGATTAAISTAAAGASGATTTFTATVKDANGNLLSGVLVTWSVDKTTAGITKTATSDKTSCYTGAAGTCTTTVFSWAAPSKVTVTATAGGKTGTGYQNFVNAASDARVLSGTANGNVVTAKVVDRYGNAVAGVTVTAKTSSGYFGSGANSTSGTTDENGEVGFAVTGGNATVTLKVNSATYTQTDDAAGYVGTTAVTASVAGTTTGTGASLSPAGVNSVSVETSAAVATSDAIDAANEATDAANAATDAANAAAEAADAATAAAQDAQAAVAELATKVASLIAGIKAQITTLTNLVIKIQKKVRA